MTTESKQGPSGPVRAAVNFHASGSLAPLLEQAGLSLLISTYQAGQLIVVGSHQGQLTVNAHAFDQVMGVALQPLAERPRLAVGTRRQVWFLHSAPDIARRIDPAGSHDACFLSRTSHVTGEIHGHEMGWGGSGELWMVNTLFSCLATIEGDVSFNPRWRPPFISALAAEDRCHLNGLAMDGGAPRYVTALAETDSPAGWRPTKATSGCIIDVASGETVMRGFAMPHSPRMVGGRLFVLDSGHGRLSVVDVARGVAEPVQKFPGYTRGMSFHGPFAFVGLSRIRETSVFGGIPLAAERENLKCGFEVVDLRSGQKVAWLHFESGVTEIFAVEAVPGARCPVLEGPDPVRDGTKTIWYVSSPRA